MITEKLIFKIPYEFAPVIIPDDYDVIFGANYFEDLDFNDTSTITFTGSTISAINSKGLNAGIFNGIGSNPNYVASVLNGKGVCRFDGVADGLRNQATKSAYNFLHNGDGGCVFIISKTRLSNPDATYRLISSWAATTDVGFAIRYDDRSSVSRNDRILTEVTRGVSGTYSAFNFSSDNAFPADNWNTLVSIIDTDVTPTVSDRSLMYVNNGTVIDNNTSTLSSSLSNATHYLNIGRTASTGVFPFDGDVARVIIINSIPTPTQLTKFYQRVAYDFGI